RAEPDPPLLTGAAADLIALTSDLAEIDLGSEPTIAEGRLTADLRIDTSQFEPGPGGLAVAAFESVRLIADANYPIFPPTVTVDHVRWLGFPHVLMGSILCLFLDPSREWDPASGMAGLLHRLWGWFE